MAKETEIFQGQGQGRNCGLSVTCLWHGCSNDTFRDSDVRSKWLQCIKKQQESIFVPKSGDAHKQGVPAQAKSK